MRPRRLELPRAFAHNDLNVARLPIPPRPPVILPPDKPGGWQVVAPSKALPRAQAAFVVSITVSTTSHLAQPLSLCPNAAYCPNMLDWLHIRREFRQVASLAWPVIVTSLNWTVMQLTDVAVVGLVSTDQAAILGASRTISFVAVVAAIGALTGVLVFAAKANGAGNLPATGRILREGLVLGALLCLMLAVPIYWLAEPMLAGIGVAPSLLSGTATVVRIIALSLPFYITNFVLSYFLEGISQPMRVTLVNLAVLPINAVLAWAMSGGHLGFAPGGAAGAAVATLIASALSASGLAAAVWFLPQAQARGVRDFTPLAWAGVLRGAGAMLVFGAMPALAAMFELGGFAIIIGLSTRLGDAVAHAYQIVFSVHNLLFAVAIGFGSAAGVRAGNAVGEGMPAAATGRVMIALGGALMTTGALVLALIIARASFIAAFPATAEVRHLASAMLLLWLPFVLFDSAQLVFAYALRSLGDQVATGVNSILAYFVVTGGTGWLLYAAGYGATGLVVASAAGMVVAAMLHGARFAILSRRACSKN